MHSRPERIILRSKSRRRFLAEANLMDEHADQTLQLIAEERRNLFFGKYRGVVLEALTGDDLGKLRVSVPDVLDDQDAVAWPCVPFAGPDHGLVAIPEKDDGVWVEFEGGNPSQPIWVGCWWGAGAMPSPGDVKVRSWTQPAARPLTPTMIRTKSGFSHPAVQTS